MNPHGQAHQHGGWAAGALRQGVRAWARPHRVRRARGCRSIRSRPETRENVTSRGKPNKSIGTSRKRCQSLPAPAATVRRWAQRPADDGPQSGRSRAIADWARSNQYAHNLNLWYETVSVKLPHTSSLMKNMKRMDTRRKSNPVFFYD